MNDINSYINEVKRDHEAIEIIETVERSVAAKVPTSRRLHMPKTAVSFSVPLASRNTVDL